MVPIMMLKFKQWSLNYDDTKIENLLKNLIIKFYDENGTLIYQCTQARCREIFGIGGTEGPFTNMVEEFGREDMWKRFSFNVRYQIDHLFDKRRNLPARIPMHENLRIIHEYLNKIIFKCTNELTIINMTTAYDLLIEYEKEKPHAGTQG